ncbi:SRPBCC domain-containing protein [Caballeronia mineralivorans]|uniref:SRPBCC family protein n=2 Tax=Caballeronia mineralivorans TaxID=2010198 RepID=UPI003211E7C9
MNRTRHADFTYQFVDDSCDTGSERSASPWGSPSKPVARAGGMRGHLFKLRANPNPHWNGVTDCEVLAVVPEKLLSYTWNSSGDEAGRLITVVTFTLTPTNQGTHLRMEQSGFRSDNEQNYQGAQYGWQKFLAELDRVVAGL